MITLVNQQGTFAMSQQISRWMAVLQGVGMVLLVAMFSESSASNDPSDEKDLWSSLASGSHVAIIRHALAPGFGDPEEFALEDCSTQRNLSAEGRAQARRIGDLFRANGIARARVMTSQWCRCRETAELMQLGDVTDLPALNSFFQDRSTAGEQTRALKEWLLDRAPGEALVLVTHQVNISALTGMGASSGEIVVFRINEASEADVIGRIPTLAE